MHLVHDDGCSSKFTEKYDFVPVWYVNCHKVPQNLIVVGQNEKNAISGLNMVIQCDRGLKFQKLYNLKNMDLNPI